MTKIKILFALVFLYYSAFTLYAANDNLPTGARSEGMGNASVCLTDAWSAFNNQAALAEISKASFAVSYHNSFLIKEMGINSFCAILPNRFGTFSFNYMSTGSDVLREQKPGLSFSRRFGPNFSAGLQFSYAMMEFPEEGKSVGAFLPEAGIISHLSSEWNLGVHIFNPFQQGYALVGGTEKIPTIIKVGCLGKLQESFLLSVEIEKELRFSPIIKVGLEYRIREMFFLRGGFNHKPGIFSLGFGYLKKRVEADIAFSHHGNLGYSPTVSISYQLGR